MSEYVNIFSNPIEVFYGPLGEDVHQFSSKSQSTIFLGTNVVTSSKILSASKNTFCFIGS